MAYGKSRKSLKNFRASNKIENGKCDYRGVRAPTATIKIQSKCVLAKDWVVC